MWIRNTFLRDTSPCLWVIGTRNLKTTYWSHLQRPWPVSCLEMLKMRQHIPEEPISHLRFLDFPSHSNIQLGWNLKRKQKFSFPTCTIYYSENSHKFNACNLCIWQSVWIKQRKHTTGTTNLLILTFSFLLYHFMLNFLYQVTSWAGITKSV
jgi:hypothetical protein